ncbi:MFS general substrate transporter [Aaosphaeria arxii CBS 175.79]|uniref:MFS general substrate transporter n=1 Tax=Aaosphaeria arxii CBS 175.79 TaxID=1450172 RepID=A0A6A5XIT4_9PLEO|nr:MFS general substrate transporter [Aaosphaeria arxii CBS 175.79]KAF2012737.1 MFS general substrate transporter [Aaosphaeria arxii CBS 175.79]
MSSKKPEVQKLENASPDVSHIEEAEAQEKRPPQEALDDDPVYSYAEQRKIIHRIDKRLIIPTGVMYCISLMDRSNLPNAAIAGMNTELEMNVGFRYSTVALVFFITYTIFQPPATVLVRKLGPRPFLAGLCFAWGAVMIGFGFVNDWVTLIPLRLLLGLFEAGFFPGCVYIISTWYSRFDMQKRYACFYLIGIIASGCSGILAYGLMQMHGLAGYWGWRWIFIIEGIMTCIVAIIGYIFLIDFPDRVMKKPHWGFLNEDEVAFILRRIDKDRSDATAEKWNFKKWAASGADWKVWSFAMIFFCLTTIAYAIGYFLPIILQENMGFNVAEAQCLTAPPYAAAGISMLALAWAGDKYRIRGPLLAGNCIFGLIGMPLLGFAEQAAVRFFGIFLICMSVHGSIPCAMAYQANNIRGHWKRAFCSATLVGFGGIGGVAGSLIFRTQDRPHYRPGVYAGIACNLLVVILIGVNTVYFRRENRKADRGEKVLEGDPNFRYTI